MENTDKELTLKLLIPDEQLNICLHQIIQVNNIIEIRNAKY